MITEPNLQPFDEIEMPPTARRFGVSELLKILWHPGLTVERIARCQVRVGPIVLAWLTLDFAAVLLFLPAFREAAAKAVSAHPEFSPAMRVLFVAIAVMVAGVFNLVFSLFAAFVLYLSTMVFAGRSSYRTVLEVVLVGSAPTLLYRSIRAVLYVVKITPKVRQSAFALAQMMPARWHRAATTVGLIDVVDLWTLGLIAYGFSRVSGLRRSVSITVVLVLWLGLQALLMRLQAIGGS